MFVTGTYSQGVLASGDPVNDDHGIVMVFSGVTCILLLVAAYADGGLMRGKEPVLIT